MRVFWIALAMILFATNATAQTDDVTKNAARTLGEEGIRLYDAGDFSAALLKFTQAEALVPVPTLALRVARCLEKVGRLVEASEHYVQTTLLAIDESAPQAFQDGQQAAKDEATKARAALLPRIPHVLLRVTGNPDALTIDGKQAPLALLGTRIPLDPKKHAIIVRAGNIGQTEEVTLAESEDREVAFDVSVKATAPPPVEPPPPTPQATSPLFHAGVVTAAVGGVSLAVGVVTWAVALNEASALEKECPNHSCPPGSASRVSSYDALRTTSIVTLIAGATLASIGLVLIIVAPKRAAVSVGPASLTFHAVF